MAKVTYINLKNSKGEVETIDEVCFNEFNSVHEYRNNINNTLTETRNAYRYTDYLIYSSNKCTNDWKNK